MANGTDPAGIVCITFTKKAANEMRERLSGARAVLLMAPFAVLVSVWFPPHYFSCPAALHSRDGARDDIPPSWLYCFLHPRLQASSARKL